MLCASNIVINISMYGGMIPNRHSRAGGNPGAFEPDSRLRGSDNHVITYLQGTALEAVSKPALGGQTTSKYIMKS